jgi:hypothetical protein
MAAAVFRVLMCLVAVVAVSVAGGCLAGAAASAAVCRVAVACPVVPAAGECRVLVVAGLVVRVPVAPALAAGSVVALPVVGDSLGLRRCRRLRARRQLRWPRRR